MPARQRQSGKLRRQECRSRIGTRRISDTDYRPDYSSRPHLLTARTHGGVTTVTRKRQKRPTSTAGAPLSSELRHCTAYPDLARKPLGLNP
ncbi:hypothetical protein B1987_15400 [Mycobacterium kansasii]|nr:hypothetical protein B1987_15400 [Mycobacterium kansasii]